MTTQEIINHPDFQSWKWFDQELVSEFDGIAYVIRWDFENECFVSL